MYWRTDSGENYDGQVKLVSRKIVCVSATQLFDSLQDDVPEEETDARNLKRYIQLDSDILHRINDRVWIRAFFEKLQHNCKQAVLDFALAD